MIDNAIIDMTRSFNFKNKFNQYIDLDILCVFCVKQNILPLAESSDGITREFKQV